MRLIGLAVTLALNLALGLLAALPCAAAATLRKSRAGEDPKALQHLMMQADSAM
jgi:hypothetical protein